MCGISGILNYNKNMYNEANRIERMIKVQNHRGPDARDVLVKENILLGHNRLIVVDPEGGKQPMTFKMGERDYTIVYNGELYNTDEIRDELKSHGYFFESYSDTEVVLKAYVEWKEDCVLKMNGIFAFGVWDQYSKSLYLARDRVGIKPLFYSKIDDYFVFSSEIKGLLASDIVPPIIGEEGLLQMFSLGPSRVPSRAIYENVNELQPGEFVQIDRDNIKHKIYWDVETKEHTENINTTAEHIRFLLTDAIERQLVSDVPLCTFLSGGLDSSLISSIASNYYKEKRGEKLSTYCIDYKGNDVYFKGDYYQPSNDNIWAKKVSNAIDSNHNRVIIDSDDLANSLWDATYANDYPGMADIDSSLYLFCKEVKKNYTVALSGECADEIFGGYPWYRNYEDVHSNFFPWIKHMDIRTNILSDNINHLKLEEYAANKYEETVNKVEYLPGEDEYNRGIRRLTYLNYKWFMVTLLTRKDRMSMANSLEVRVPFADHRIIEYAYNIPWTIKYCDNYEKGILRKAMKDYLPKDVLYRKKSPFPKTYNPEYMSQLKGMLKVILDKKNSPINNLINKEYIQQFVDNKGATLDKPWFGQLMKEPQFIAYLIQINCFLDMNNVRLKGV